MHQVPHESCFARAKRAMQFDERTAQARMCREFGRGGGAIGLVGPDEARGF